MASSFRTDPLLATARTFLSFIITLVIIAMAGVALAIPAVVIWRGAIIATLVEQNGAVAHPGALILSFVAILALGLAILFCGYRMFLLLRRIVDSVAEGDPFVPENAERLRAMGWLAIAGQLIGVPAAIIGGWIAFTVKNVDFDFGISLGGLLLALTLFILARVFQQGAAMRNDLEGTV
ncbi:hypothetical protein GCM10011515_01630 [Tsuneonella deserti]|uniref:DUF2975 domain-containing protein n=1 Tax=Tsuneonella deserti TaxID=2035528 RepID=A0ABQ1RWR5_9SPHN|nr:DUF2975 domain-containing protein [Tsuneonella deserti]GGD85670.1 hypothetical protein GCM10011515_01630 [Tsuneonella deserti]